MAKYAPKSITDQEVREHDRNPRKISPRAMSGLRTSIAQFGDLSGFTINRRTGNIVCGHQRRKAASGLNPGDISWSKPYETPWGEERDGYFEIEGGARFRVRMVDWDKDKEEAALVTANNPHIMGDWLNDDLQDLLSDIEVADHKLFEELALPELVMEEKEPAVEAEVHFSEYIDEANNYVVLLFKNDIDWLSALTHFELGTKTSKRQNGKPWSSGIGRVVDGAEYLKQLTEQDVGGTDGKA